MIKAIILGHNVYGSYMKQFIDRGYNRIVNEYKGEEIEPVAYWDYFGSTASDDADLPVLNHEMVRSSFEDGIIEYDLFYEEFGYQFFTADFEPDGYDCLRDSFIGPDRTETNPLGVEKGILSGSSELGGNHCGALHKKLIL